jgi:signal transduction histidine kinase
VERLLQPFQRRGTPRSGDGLGLGLSIVQAIAVAHGGGLRLTPRPGGGLTAELAFPAVSGTPMVRSPQALPVDTRLPASHTG